MNIIKEHWGEFPGWCGISFGSKGIDTKMTFPVEKQQVMWSLQHTVILWSNILQRAWIDHHSLPNGHPPRRIMSVSMNVDHHVILLSSRNTKIITCSYMAILHQHRKKHQFSFKLKELLPISHCRDVNKVKDFLLLLDWLGQAWRTLYLNNWKDRVWYYEVLPM